MSDNNNDKNHNQEFTLVKYKKKSRRVINKPINNLLLADQDFDKETAVRRIKEAKAELLDSNFYLSIVASLREGLDILRKPKVEVIICLGLGKFSECMISRYQFALLLCLQELFHCPVHAYDPAFTENETSLLEEFKFTNIDENNEGKYSTDAKTTFFYLPHCPKQLSNNLLWANWGLSLNNCIIVANSFNKILETHMKRVLMESANYVMKISPYMVELAIINSFKYYDMFNDTSLHIFPIDKLQLVSSEFWSDKEEPKYISDVEYIVKKMQEL